MQLTEELQVCDNIAGLEVGNTVEKTGVTHFVQEACEAVEALGSHYVRGDAVPQKDLQNLTEYFARPRLLTQFTASTGAVGQQYYVALTDLVLFPSGTTGLIPNAKSRLLGVYGVRFSLVFTVQVAASPFHQGVLAAAFQYGLVSSSAPATYNRVSSPWSCTMLPHVRLDISSATMAQLKVPFVSQDEFLCIAQETGLTYGNFAISAILPVPSVTGLSPPTVNVYMHIEDLELISAAPEAVANVALQSGDSLLDKEQARASGRVAAVSGAMKLLAKGIPSLSSIAQPTSWFLDSVSGGLRAYGFSKPVDERPPRKVFSSSHVMESNVDVPSEAIVVGPCASNRLKVDPKFAFSDVDEMAYGYLLSRWSQVCLGYMSTSNLNGAQLYISPLSPCCFWYRTPASAPYCNVPAPIQASSASYNSFYPSSVLWLSSMHMLWRGGFRFRFTFAKSKMHAGRVQVAFSPGYQGLQFGGPTYPSVNVASSLTSVGPQPFGLTAVFDLKDGNVFTFDVPYTHFTPYLRFAESFGTLAMTVVDPLQAPSVVSSSISFLVEVCAMPDYELALPCCPVWSAAPKGNVQLQSGTLVQSIHGGTSENCIGEKLMSVKQLIQIPHVLAPTTITGSKANTQLVSWYTYNAPTASTPASTNFSFAKHIVTAFLFARGSTEAHIYWTAGTPTTLVQIAAGPDATTSSLQQPTNYAPSGLPTIVFSGGSSVHVRLPFYGQRERAFAGLANGPMKLGATLAASDDGLTSPAYVYMTHYLPSSTATGILSTAAGDDAMLGMYMGPPPLLIAASGTVPTGPWDPDSWI